MEQRERSLPDINMDRKEELEEVEEEFGPLWQEEEDHALKRASVLVRSASSNTQNETASLTLSDNSSLDTIDEEVAFDHHDVAMRRRNLVVYDIPKESLSLNYNFRVAPNRKKKKEQHPSRRRMVLTVLLSLFIAIVVIGDWYTMSGRRGRRRRHRGVDSRTRQKWQQQLKDAPTIHDMAQKVTRRRRYIVRLRATRVDLVERITEELLQCSSVKQLQVDWKPTTAVPPPLLLKDKVVAFGGDGMLTSDAILLLNEDVLLSCAELDRGKHTHTHTRLWVSPFPRMPISNPTLLGFFFRL